MVEDRESHGGVGQWVGGDDGDGLGDHVGGACGVVVVVFDRRC